MQNASINELIENPLGNRSRLAIAVRQRAHGNVFPKWLTRRINIFQVKDALLFHFLVLLKHSSDRVFVEYVADFVIRKKVLKLEDFLIKERPLKLV